MFALPQLMQKVRGQEVGHEYVERRLLALGARALRARMNPAGWLADALNDIHAVRLRHGGSCRTRRPTTSVVRPWPRPSAVRGHDHHRPAC